MLKIIPGDKKFSRLLSVGCSYGMELQKVSKMLNINKAIGIDISEITIKMAEKVSSSCIFIVGDACYLPFNNDSFDLVILSDIIEHIEQPEILLKEAQRVAKYAVMNIPLEKCFKTRKRKYGVTVAQNICSP